MRRTPEAGVVLRHLLREMHVEGPALGRLYDAAELVAGDGADRVDRGTDPDRLALPETVDARRPGGGAAVVVPHLHALRRLPETRG